MFSVDCALATKLIEIDYFAWLHENLRRSVVKNAAGPMNIINVVARVQSSTRVQSRLEYQRK